jgi:hypothetical protein
MTGRVAWLKTKSGKLAGVGAAMALLLVAAVAQRQITLAGAAELVMISEAVDPRELLAGHYAILNLQPQSLTMAPGASPALKVGRRAFVRLQPTGEKGGWTAAALTPGRPALEPQERFARVTITSVGDDGGQTTIWFSYGPDRIYLSQAEAEAVEKASRRMWIEPSEGPEGTWTPATQKPVYAILAVTAAGDVWIKGVELDGERLEARW